MKSFLTAFSILTLTLLVVSCKQEKITNAGKIMEEKNPSLTIQAALDSYDLGTLKSYCTAEKYSSLEATFKLANAAKGTSLATSDYKIVKDSLIGENLWTLIERKDGERVSLKLSKINGKFLLDKTNRNDKNPFRVKVKL